MLTGRPVKEWVVDGIECQTWPGWAGALNGYVRLPEGVDKATLRLPGRWQDYGPNEDRWIGFDTSHAWDRWSADDRRRFGALLVDEEGPYPMEAVESMIGIHERYLDRPDATMVWTEKRVEGYVTEVARSIARQLRGESPPPERCPVHGTEEDPWPCPIAIEGDASGEETCELFMEEMNRRVAEVAAGNFWKMDREDGRVVFREFVDYEPTGRTRPVSSSEKGAE